MRPHTTEMIPYAQGLGREEEVKVLSDTSLDYFNTKLNQGLADGWRIVQALECTPISNSMYIHYTIVLARPRGK